MTAAQLESRVRNTICDQRNLCTDCGPGSPAGCVPTSARGNYYGEHTLITLLAMRSVGLEEFAPLSPFMRRPYTDGAIETIRNETRPNNAVATLGFMKAQLFDQGISIAEFADRNQREQGHHHEEVDIDRQRQPRQQDRPHDDASGICHPRQPDEPDREQHDGLERQGRMGETLQPRLTADCENCGGHGGQRGSRMPLSS